MARRTRDDDLLMEDELTAAFLGEDDAPAAEPIATDEPAAAPAEEWDEEEIQIHEAFAFPSLRSALSQLD